MNNNKNLTVNENQFFSIEKKGRDGLQSIIKHYGAEMWSARPSGINGVKKEAFFNKSVVNIANDDKLKPFLQNRNGLFQVYKCLSEAVQVGLVVGGLQPLCEIVHYGNQQLSLNLRAEGYVYLATNTENAPFKEIISRSVYKGETFSVDFAENKIIHSWDGLSAQGDLIACYVKMTKTDGSEVIYLKRRDEIENIKNKHSSGYRAFKANKIKSTPWADDYAAMALKTTIKGALRPYAKTLKALSIALDAEEAESYRNTDINDRMDNRLEKVLENEQKPIIEIAPDEPAAIEAVKPSEKTGELF